MARKGREPWSSRIIVENCLAFDIASLVRAGVFRAKPGSLCSTVWKNSDGQETFRAYFWMEMTADGRTLLHISHGVPSSVPLMHHARSETIEIAQTPLRFGPRPWFLCPGVHNNAPCRRRVRILYFPPNAGRPARLGCRKCLNLIHRSAREHDNRLDALLRLSPEEFEKVLTGNNLRKALLAVRASFVQVERLKQKIARYALARKHLPESMNH
jgi:hypothetical protein